VMSWSFEYNDHNTDGYGLNQHASFFPTIMQLISASWFPESFDNFIRCVLCCDTSSTEMSPPLKRWEVVIGKHSPYRTAM
jgi:hypothetical protein